MQHVERAEPPSLQRRPGYALPPRYLAHLDVHPRPAGVAGAENHSLRLWEKWRQVALGGGLAASAGKARAAEVARAMAAEETEAFRAAVTPEGEHRAAPPDFAAAVERELKLLLSAPGSKAALDRCARRETAC